MALYAFDGTWNQDEELDSKDTNVVRFKEVYDGKEVEYLTGVGTRFRRFGRIVGGLFGAGGRSRIREMYEELTENWNQGDRDIDIVGFSRGAALAVHFANKIGKDGIELEDGSKEVPKIRFLGLWDVVASFGLSFDTFINFQEINLGWNVDEVAECVDNCAHAMALDERRETFNVTRLNPGHSHGNIQEVWFRGVHSDVGGGNENPDRSNIAFAWMLGRARAAGVPINEDKAGEDKYRKTDLRARVSENKDAQRDERRRVLDGDEVDDSARHGALDLGQSHTCVVDSKLKYNWSGVRLNAGATYRIEVAGDQTWQDGDLECGADGWDTSELGRFKKTVVKRLEDNRRHPEAQWFELIAALDDEDDELVRIGKGVELQAPRDADLYLFANDLKLKYGNNKGSIEVTIERIG